MLAKPDWAEAARGLIKPEMHYDIKYLSMVLGIIGTTVAPWMQFYMQSAVIEKGLKIENYKYTMLDVVVGAVIAP